MQTAPEASNAQSRRRAVFFPRVDMYGSIHKGLRWVLSRELLRLGNMSLSNPSELAAVLGDMEGLFAVLATHTLHEERFLHTALEQRRPGLTRLFDASHRSHERLIDELRALASALGVASPDTRPALRRSLYLRFSAFVGEQLVHMVDEEEVLQPALDELFTPEELYAIYGNILASIAPDEMLAALKMMLPALDRDERVVLVSGPKNAMPPEAFASILHGAREVLAAEDFEDLTTRL